MNVASLTSGDDDARDRRDWRGGPPKPHLQSQNQSTRSIAEMNESDGITGKTECGRGASFRLMRADDRIRPVVMPRGWMFDQPRNHDEQRHEQEHKVDPDFHRRVLLPFDAPQSLARPSIGPSSTRPAEMRAA